MKKVKIMMLSLVLLAVVGGALAFKAKGPSKFCTIPALSYDVPGDPFKAAYCIWDQNGRPLGHPNFNSQTSTTIDCDVVGTFEPEGGIVDLCTSVAPGGNPPPGTDCSDRTCPNLKEDVILNQ